MSNTKYWVKIERRLKLLALYWLGYFLIVVIIIVGFAGIYQVVDEDKADTVFFDHLYFSGVTYLTIGYGDITPNNDESKIIVIIEGIFGIIVNGIFIGLIITLMQRKDNKIIISKQLFIKEHNNELILQTGLKNFSEFLVDIRRSIEIGELINDRYERQYEFHDERNYFRRRSIISIKINEDPKLKEIIKSIIQDSKAFRVRIFLKGIDVKNNDLVTTLEEFTINEVNVVKSFDVIPEIKYKGLSLNTSFESNFSYEPLSQEEENSIRQTLTTLDLPPCEYSV